MCQHQTQIIIIELRELTKIESLKYEGVLASIYNIPYYLLGNRACLRRYRRRLLQ